MREMLASFLADQTGHEVCGMAATAEEALQQVEEAAPDLLLIDVSLPGMNGIELVQALKSRWPDLLCLMTSGHAETKYSERALAVGAQGYLLKGNPYELPEAIGEVLRGKTYLSESLRSA